MRPRILLVNPPIFDFSAYDFWAKPYGLLAVAGRLRGRAELRLFDFLDRLHPFYREKPSLRRGSWGRGEFHSRVVPKPAPFAAVPRRFRRFGLPRGMFREFLAGQGPFDFALVATGMTYWYPGVAEVIEDLRRLCPSARIALGGVYASLCPVHAWALGADLVVEGADLAPLWRLLEIPPDPAGPALWEGYPEVEVGAMKLTDGCPFRCTYCSVPRLHPGFSARAPERSLAEFDLLCRLGVRDVAFYDDALLLEPEQAVIPFLAEVVRRGAAVNFHTPNALHARLVTAELAELMVRAGFKTFYLGFESASDRWQRATGAKVAAADLARAVGHLTAAGAAPASITAYLLLAHPDSPGQDVEAAMHFVQDLGIRIMLAEFSPIPGTPDGQAAGRWVDMDEPLNHNKTAFAITALGEAETNRLKQLARDLNAALEK